MILKRISFAIITLTFATATFYSEDSYASRQYPPSNDYKDSHTGIEEVGKVGLIIGVVGLATYGMVKIGEWLFHKSDETVTELAQKTLREASAQYVQITAILNKNYAGTADRETCITDISEPTLYEIARTKYHDADIALYLQHLASTIQHLHKYAKNLHERIQITQSQETQDYGTLRLIARMKSVESDMQTMLPSLTFTFDYLSYHQSFFALFETEDSMMYRYERDLHAINSYQGDLSYLREMIHQSVMLYQRRHADPYPYRWYLKRLEDDIHLLHVAINRLACAYINRINVAQVLCNKLEFIRETLIGSPYYADELRAYEYAKIAQAALEAQQRQAHAQEEQSRQLKLQNELHAFELQANHHIDWV